jgi:hypothetical protein
MAVWTSVVFLIEDRGIDVKIAMSKACLLKGEYRGGESVWIRRSWLKCRPVGKGNENDFAPEAENGSRAFRVV